MAARGALKTFSSLRHGTVRECSDDNKTFIAWAMSFIFMLLNLIMM